MRFHCNNCRKDFTSFSERDSKRRLAFTAIFHYLDQIACPHCNATNKIKRPKPLKETGARWQPKHRSTSPDDYDGPPSIVLFHECRKRWNGSGVNCEGCPFRFNCLTGNVDDGQLETDDPDYVEKKEAEKDSRNREIVEQYKQRQRKQKLLEVRNYLAKKGVTCDNAMRVTIGGTTWKLSDVDIVSIKTDTWETDKTRTIKKSLVNKNIGLKYLRYLISEGR